MSCKQCSKCCSFCPMVFITAKEKKRIIDYCAKNNIKEIERKNMRLPFQSCKFLVNGLCIIHEVKPATCKEFDCTTKTYAKRDKNKKFVLDMI